ncbi:hypothetical protein SAMN05421767_10719 [Granulicatella balaenopterae]|uniref:Uncharacterized protein n=1 Tax=Granulicatella balaenopterae TaxID=137733 RepID=A0A1H9IY90_9LACT|nr:hypothetical protein [Granulicatella balaenopterae]SEQ79573.1 hypothetical protein SAMN05421767_10719 [Granulicatella balaenopterae]
MEKIKTEIKNKIKKYEIIIIVAIVMLVISKLVITNQQVPASTINESLKVMLDAGFLGYNAGLISVLIVAIGSLKYLLYKNDEKKLKEYYITYADERYAYIMTKSGMMPNLINSFVILYIGYYMQNISIYIYITCLIIAMLLSIQSLTLRAYYMNKL